MNRRMNLFRQFAESGKKTGAKWKLPTGLSFHLAVSSAVTFLLVVGLLTNYVAYRRQTTAVKIRMEKTKNEIAELTAQSEKIAVDARKAESEQRAPAAAAADTVSPAVSDLDGTWTSLLWKVAAFTGPTVQIDRMGLGGGGSGTPTDSRKEVAFEGRAKSVSAIRLWIESLIRSIPGYVFIMEGESTADLSASEATYPVAFKVTARSQ